MPRIILLSLLVCLLAVPAMCADRPPNVVIIFLDDSGWADFKPFGEPKYPTPNVNRLAEEGLRFNRFYVPQAVCSASRSALLSGCFPGRTGVFGAHGPDALGLDPKFNTMGEVLQGAGYATAVFGKWHIGDTPATRPNRRGFDESAGLMYSNDMWKHHPENPEHWGKHPLKYWENGEVTIPEVDHEHQAMLTTWYTEKAVDFIQRKKDEPFFVYLPHSMPHVPLYVSEKFAGKSGQGLYADVMMEIDWSVGEVMKALRESGVEDNTLVMFTSDNGPWITYGNHAGVTPWRESKGTTFDGGIRSAFIMKYPGVVPAGETTETMLCSVDILPMVADVAGAKLPDYEIDGKNLWDHVLGKTDAPTPQKYYEMTNGGEFQGVISGDGRWKLHIPHQYRTLDYDDDDGVPGKYKSAQIGFALFDMVNDPLESKNVIDDHRDIALELIGYANAHQQKFFAKK